MQREGTVKYYYNITETGLRPGTLSCVAAKLSAKLTPGYTSPQATKYKEIYGY